MRRLRALTALILVLLAPYTSALAHEPEPPNTVLGMSYSQAALVTAAVIAGAVTVNTFIAPNIGTILAALYLGHFAVEAAIVFSGAGATWGLGWWDTEVPPTPPPTAWLVRAP